MVGITVRNLDSGLKSRLPMRAARALFTASAAPGSLPG